MDAIVGDVWLRVAGDDEPAVRMLGERDARAPYPREIIYADDAGAICRRWNWKEADRTKLSAETTAAVLVLEILPPITRQSLDDAMADLVSLIHQFCGEEVQMQSAVLNSELRKIDING